MCVGGGVRREYFYISCLVPFSMIMLFSVKGSLVVIIDMYHVS